MRIVALFCFCLLVAACSPADPLRTAPNPDLNHTHANLIIFTNGEQLDISGDAYMSGVSYDEESHDEEDEYLHQFLHLHDNIGAVVHRHKPGLTLADFLGSIGLSFTDLENCVRSTLSGATFEICGEHPYRFFVNGEEKTPFDLNYVFEDLDQMLITNATTDEIIQSQLTHMPDDACLYSRTCPQRGDPPAENCIADPSVPCVAPLD